MNVKSKIFPEDSKEFPWDKKALETFKRLIIAKEIKCRMDDIFLLGFLRARKFDQERSIQLLQNYYKRRCEYPRYFKDLLPSKLQHALSLNSMQFLPKPDQAGRYVFIIQLASWDVNVTDVTDYFRTLMMFFDFQLNYHRTQENSIVFINNAEGFTLRHLLQCTPRLIIAVVTLLFRESYQLRMNEIHYVNINAVLKALLSLAFPLFSRKIQERVHLHSEMSTLHKFVHPQYLPVEYGGELPNFDPTEMNEMIIDNEEFFRKNESYLKIYEEDNNKKFTEGRFKYLNLDGQDNQLSKLIEDTEEKFKRLEENPESYLSYIDSEFEITRL